MALRNSQALRPSSGCPAPRSLAGSESQATAPALQTWTGDGEVGVLPVRGLARGSGNHTAGETLTWREGTLRTGILVCFLLPCPEWGLPVVAAQSAAIK